MSADELVADIKFLEWYGGSGWVGKSRKQGGEPVRATEDECSDKYKIEILLGR